MVGALLAQNAVRNAFRALSNHNTVAYASAFYGTRERDGVLYIADNFRNLISMKE
jgi:hypothetical protein